MVAVEKVSPGQKVLNRYLYTGGVFAGLAALTIAHYTWVSPDWPAKLCGAYESNPMSWYRCLEGSWRADERDTPHRSIT